MDSDSQSASQDPSVVRARALLAQVEKRKREGERHQFIPHNYFPTGLLADFRRSPFSLRLAQQFNLQQGRFARDQWIDEIASRKPIGIDLGMKSGSSQEEWNEEEEEEAEAEMRPREMEKEKEKQKEPGQQRDQTEQRGEEEAGEEGRVHAADDRRDGEAEGEWESRRLQARPIKRLRKAWRENVEEDHKQDVNKAGEADEGRAIANELSASVQPVKKKLHRIASPPRDRLEGEKASQIHSHHASSNSISNANSIARDALFHSSGSVVRQVPKPFLKFSESVQRDAAPVPVPGPLPGPAALPVEAPNSSSDLPPTQPVESLFSLKHVASAVSIPNPSVAPSQFSQPGADADHEFKVPLPVLTRKTLKRLSDPPAKPESKSSVIQPGSLLENSQQPGLQLEPFVDSLEPGLL